MKWDLLGSMLLELLLAFHFDIGRPLQGIMLNNHLQYYTMSNSVKACLRQYFRKLKFISSS